MVPVARRATALKEPALYSLRLRDRRILPIERRMALVTARKRLRDGWKWTREPRPKVHPHEWLPLAFYVVRFDLRCPERERLQEE